MATACEFAFGMAVGPDLPAKTLSEFIAWAPVNPGKAQFGFPGAGSAMHFIGVKLAAQAKFELQHIRDRGGAPALTDVMGGTIPAVFTTLSNLVQPHKAGKVRILAHSAAQRLPGLPDVPTFGEPGARAVLEAAEYTPLTLSQEAIARRLVAENEHWRALVKSTGYKSED